MVARARGVNRNRLTSSASLGGQQHGDAVGTRGDAQQQVTAYSRFLIQLCGSGARPYWMIETCKLTDVDPLAYLTDVLTRIVNGHPNSDIDQLLPWAYRVKGLKAVA